MLGEGCLRDQLLVKTLGAESLMSCLVDAISRLSRLVAGGMECVQRDSTRRGVWQLKLGLELWALSHAPLSFTDCVLYPFAIMKRGAEYGYPLGPMSPSSESRGGPEEPLTIPLPGSPKGEAWWIPFFRARQAGSMDPVP